jgi:hypothetical protein
MISVQTAVSRVRRHLALGTAIKLTLLVTGAAAVFAGSIVGTAVDGSLVLIAVMAIWLVLSYYSIRGSRLAASSPPLIAAGQYDQAEEMIDRSLRSFSLFGATRMMALHHLAMLRHAQRRWSEAAALCRALLGQRLSLVGGFSKSARLILADSLLETNDLSGAYSALSGLYTQRLSLAEATNLLAVQLDYLWRVSAWADMFDNIATKVQICELMPTRQAARAQALLALAARKSGQSHWEQWLRRRVELLVDVRGLATERPVLWELWAQSTAA